MESNSQSDLHEIIRRRAEEIYYRNGRIPGRDRENWAQAEKEILEEQELAAAQSQAQNQAKTGTQPEVEPRRTAIIVRVNGQEYIGEYTHESSDGYRPGEFDPGASVPVRFHGDKMLIKRPNGKILETILVQKRG